MLVVLSDEFKDDDDMCTEKKLNTARYNLDGINKTYYGGDLRSWQRYTRELPVKGKIEVASNRVVFVPNVPLRPETWYALLWLHTNHEFLCPIYEDYVILFRTSAAVP